MSVSVHMNGRKRSDMRAPLARHQARLNEEDGKRALKDTDSAIDPKLTHMNVALVPDQSRTRFKEMKKKLDIMSEKRVARGGKRIYKSANVFMVGTLQISDDSLEKLGWKWGEDGKKLPADQQDEKTIENVKLVYADMLQSVQAQPEIYGEVFSATLHMDEGSPHVDFMTDVLDVNEPDKLVAHYTQGVKGRKAQNGRPAVKGTPKGEKLRNMQDCLMKHSKLSKETIEKFDLKRGETKKEKMDKVRNIRKAEKGLDIATRALEARREAFKEWEGELSRREQMLEEREKRAKFRDEMLEVKEMALKAQISRLEALKAVEDRFTQTVAKYEHRPDKMAKIRAILQKHAKPLRSKDIVEMSEELDEMNDDGTKTLDEQTKETLQSDGLADFTGEDIADLNESGNNLQR